MGGGYFRLKGQNLQRHKGCDNPAQQRSMGTKCGQQAMKPDKLTVARGRVEGQTHPGSRQALQQEAGGSPEGAGTGSLCWGPQRSDQGPYKRTRGLSWWPRG